MVAACVVLVCLCIAVRLCLVCVLIMWRFGIWLGWICWVVACCGLDFTCLVFACSGVWLLFRGLLPCCLGSWWVLCGALNVFVG